MRRSWLGHVTGAAALAFLVAGLFVPLAAIVWRGVAPAGGTPLAGLVATLTDPYYLGRLWFTTWQALLSTALTVAVGLPTALLLARYGFAGRRLLTAAFSVPFVMPTVVAGMGFLALAGPRGLLGVDLRGTLVLVLAAHVFYNFAIVARLVSGFLEGLGPRLEQAAATLGAGAWRTLWRVTLPLALPATVAAATLVFVFCFTSFGVVLILAPEARFATLEVELYRLTLRLLRLDAAAALALVQLVVVGGLGLAYTRLQARLAVPFAAGRAVARRPRGVGAALLGADLLVIAAVVLAPLLALTVQALTAPDGAFPSATNLRAMFDAPRSVGFATLGLSLRNSLTFAGLSTAAALVVGTAFAYAVARGGWRWLDGLSLLPLATSPVTLGLGYLVTYPWLVATFWGVPLAHALIAFPFVTRTLLPALRALPAGQARAAATLGAGPWRTLWRVELPQLVPSLAVAAAFAFAVSLGEFGASLLLVRPEFATLPVAIYDRLGRPGALNYGAALGLSLVLMGVTTLVMLVLQRRERGEF
ncbi:MAG TPA: iron ABC transporter permease [Trueperaceae bacterium]|nr:iron ABC transporter permease [Trueperaceae bacterium]